VGLVVEIILVMVVVIVSILVIIGSSVRRGSHSANGINGSCITSVGSSYSDGVGISSVSDSALGRVLVLFEV
jgi:hypothetical protein